MKVDAQGKSYCLIRSDILPWLHGFADVTVISAGYSECEPQPLLEASRLPVRQVTVPWPHLAVAKFV